MQQDALQEMCGGRWLSVSSDRAALSRQLQCSTLLQQAVCRAQTCVSQYAMTDGQKGMLHELILRECWTRHDQERTEMLCK